MFSASKSSAPVSGGLLSKSLRFRSSASAYLSRTPASATNQQKWTWSGWVKRGTFNSGVGLFSAPNGTSDTTWFDILIDANNKLNISGYSTYWRITTQIFRDPSAWYHIVVAVDTTQATANNRILVYVNGMQITAFDTTNNMAQNANTGINASAVHYLGRSSSSYLDGYQADVYLIDGQQLTPSSFGATDATTGQWSPAKYTGTYGTNGFHLTFANATSTTTLGYDTSGNSNNWTTNNISLTAGSTYDSMNDVPVAYSATASNYAVLNPLEITTTTAPTNGNLTYSPSGTSPQVAIATIAIPATGNWYAEFTKSSTTANWAAGVIGPGRTDTYVAAINSIGYFDAGQIYKNGFLIQSSLATLSNGDVLGVAVNTSALTIQFYKNGSALGTAVSYSYSQTWFACGNYVSGLVYNANFGQQPWAYTPPSGYVGLNTYNIATGTVTTTGTFTGNSSANGPFVYLNGTPTAMTINGNIVTFGTDANKLANGFKVTSSSSLYNLSIGNTYIVTTAGAVFKVSDAQSNP